MGRPVLGKNIGKKDMKEPEEPLQRCLKLPQACQNGANRRGGRGAQRDGGRGGRVPRVVMLQLAPNIQKKSSKVICWKCNQPEGTRKKKLSTTRSKQTQVPAVRHQAGKQAVAGLEGQRPATNEEAPNPLLHSGSSSTMKNSHYPNATTPLQPLGSTFIAGSVWNISTDGLVVSGTIAMVPCKITADTGSMILIVHLDILRNATGNLQQITSFLCTMPHATFLNLKNFHLLVIGRYVLHYLTHFKWDCNET